MHDQLPFLFACNSSDFKKTDSRHIHLYMQDTNLDCFDLLG